MTIVVKVGGAAGNALDPVLDELATRDGLPPRPRRFRPRSTAWGRRSAARPRYYTSPSGVVSRRSDPAHLEVVVLALAGTVQTELVAGLAPEACARSASRASMGRLLLARLGAGARAMVDGRVVHRGRPVRDRSSGVDGPFAC